MPKVPKIMTVKELSKHVFSFDRINRIKDQIFLTLDFSSLQAPPYAVL
jgi:hypothetical protein